ncbi:AAA family ATPase [Candidatus Parcubacteria bacterium]|nr:AAA family ATPase [Candidatus Parcubacteria bacterium]
MNKLYFITGASGSGKTTLIKNLEKKNLRGVETFIFDSVGVPSEEEMKEKYGSGEKWQKETTKYWVRKIKESYLDKSDVVLDGSINYDFIEEACKQFKLQNFKIILIDCSDEERKKRLIDRGQGELYNQDMINWSQSLRKTAIEKNYTIIDNTNYSQEETLEELLGYLN